MRKKRSMLHVLFALLVAGDVIYGACARLGPLPPPGPVLNPVTGIWTTASLVRPAHSETLHVRRLQRPVTVILEANGTPISRPARTTTCSGASATSWRVTA